MTPASAIDAVVCDFGGVLTSPVIEGFVAFQRSSGIALEELRDALAAIARRNGAHPLYELERGRIAERDFLDALGQQLEQRLGRAIALDDFGQRYFGSLRPNDAMIDFVRGLRAGGLRTALLTNNVAAWEPYWRALAPIDELFEVVVNSAHVGMRKPEPEIYQLTLRELGVSATRCAFIDDLVVNCEAARALGMHAIWFQQTEQAIAAIEGLLDGQGG